MKTSKEEMLANGPIISTMLKLGIPTFIAQLINLLYNVIDRIYIGHIPGSGSSALTGLGICFPILTLVTAFAAFAGSGGTPLCGISLGNGDKKTAEKIIGNCATLLIFSSILLTVVFYLIKKPFLYMFGASDITYPYADAYISIYLLGTIFVLLSLGLNSFIIAQGHSATAMISVIIGAVCNIILDPIFIFALSLGVRGAAFATIISQGITTLWVIRFLISNKATLKLRVANLAPDFKIIGKVAALGQNQQAQRDPRRGKHADGGIRRGFSGMIDGDDADSPQHTEHDQADELVFNAQQHADSDSRQGAVTQRVREEGQALIDRHGSQQGKQGRQQQKGIQGISDK